MCDMYRGVDYGMDEVLLPVSESEQDANNGCIQPDSRQRHQWSKCLVQLSCVEFAFGISF